MDMTKEDREGHERLFNREGWQDITETTRIGAWLFSFYICGSLFNNNNNNKMNHTFAGSCHNANKLEINYHRDLPLRPSVSVKG